MDSMPTRIALLLENGGKSIKYWGKYFLEYDKTWAYVPKKCTMLYMTILVVIIQSVLYSIIIYLLKLYIFLIFSVYYFSSMKSFQA